MNLKKTKKFILYYQVVIVPEAVFKQRGIFKKLILTEAVTLYVFSSMKPIS